MKTVKRTVDAWLGRIAGRAAPPSNCFYHRSDDAQPVLQFLRDVAGFVIDVRPKVPVETLKFARHLRLTSEQYALALLHDELATAGCTVLQRGRTLTILTLDEAKKAYMPLPTIGAF
jgi:hypothetical protein